MAGSLNKVMLIGNLGADPEVKSFQNGGRIANLRIATSETWKDRQTGERKERTDWHNVVLQSDGLVGVAERFLRKGSKVYIEGQLRTRKWQDKDGSDRFSTEIRGDVMQMLGGRQGGGMNDSAPRDRGGEMREPMREPAAASSAKPAAAKKPAGQFNDLDDDIPF